MDIYVMQANGSNPRRLTARFQRWAAWSPDGRRIVFESDRRGSFDLYVMNRRHERDALGTSPVTNTTWSWDGSRIAYA
jgi:TolB protein